jgi:hypothetical protein
LQSSWEEQDWSRDTLTVRFGSSEIWRLRKCFYGDAETEGRGGDSWLEHFEQITPLHQVTKHYYACLASPKNQAHKSISESISSTIPLNRRKLHSELHGGCPFSKFRNNVLNL